MKVLVTGGAGFIGSNLVEAMVKNGDEVTVLDNLHTGKLNNLKPVIKKINFINGDIRNLTLLNKILKNVNYVSHQAALTSVPKSMNNSKKYNEINVI